MTREDKRNLVKGLLFTAPWLVGLAVFTTIPALMSLYFSFCDYSVLNPPVFIGATNFTEIGRAHV